jgi:hypothetical protein
MWVECSDFFDIVGNVSRKWDLDMLNYHSIELVKPHFVPSKYNQNMWQLDIFGHQRVDYLELFRRYGLQRDHPIS